ncbi:N-acyl-aromatic-L-amino acid amidohydrolase (carboxylate-forming) B-like [Tachysurus fulvidraco]|uniref:N-acyl-aromatic-L-amino acid amidohydrolase (carboxylate-forming) B-like n=1 Tax=Tachysurus fulvidraco TaxID=1234273 RepID=UPI001FF002FF|nr:N-acyl-aromatic-L-amino acid amidohydrolase (carboxylate-forming) B-like [Tachysurus fulvidraco]XP_026999881.2 N-acyl-aromatic-L-amino acid amidohydrolase (carboxylate-forming) B-like [Tachysurus fulvidraco]XP_047671877.1 N-acyl-aromatic-L-amino acid amidohydrolase (carboxylate-forming) B-like [Tachysurus fulvidraco]XP_047671878.1 N-acyl-aromatic-L-amino acid amidohydrolase (carboxylate-forming) B-like [Tachysurus fulvidraco]
MERIRLPVLRHVAICGGTHGNEMTGIHLVQELERQQKEKGDAPWPVSVTLVLSNPRAVKECKRYIDMDLNRCFTSATLSSPITDDTPYEIQRAQELNSLLGPKGSEGAVELICDLHNTTANMGLTIISYSHNNWICLHIFKHLQEKITNVPVKLVLLNLPLSAAYSLESVSKYGCSLEVGPQPHGIVRADIFNVMKQGVDAILDWTETFNSGKLIEGGEIEAYIIQKSMDYPRDPKTGKPSAAIHPQLQDQDFCLLQHGDPVFLTFSGETLSYEEEEPLHPLFINEAAYYEKGIAFHLAHKKTLNIPGIQAETA